MKRIFNAFLATLFTMLIVISACEEDDEIVTEEASITSLNCSSATFSATATDGESYSATASVPYTGGNEGTYSAGSTIASTGVEGLSAILVAGTLADGAGSFTYTITGTPEDAGTASFAITFGDQSCTLTLTVDESTEDEEEEDTTATITALDCSSATFSTTATSGVEYTATLTVPYSGGNGLTYEATDTVASTGVEGLTAILEAGTLADGSGSITYNITGTPESSGTASFEISFLEQTCTAELTVSAVYSSDCSSLSGIEKIVCMADEFKALLSSSQLSTVQRSYSITEAKKWSNLPNADRVGLTFGNMTDEQVESAKALLAEVSGTTENEGWDELQQMLYADDYLQENGGGSAYGEDNYYLAFLGTPAETGTFEIQFGGHHMAFANTYIDGELVGATPSFRGIEPYFAFSWEGDTYQPLIEEKNALTAMLEGLSTNELASAKLSSTFGDVIAGPQEDDNFPSTSSGIKCSDLTSEQQALVLAAIKTYVDDVASSEGIMTKYTNELDETYISYSGTTNLTTRNDYVRIDGPSVWIEYSCQNGVILSGTHPHSVWRDKLTDYGGN